MLAKERKGIAFQDDIAKAVPDLVFVVSAFNNSWNENFPDPCFDAPSHGMRPAIPAIEIANHADPLCTGSPDRETHTRMAIDFSKVRSEFFVDLIVVADLVQVHVQFT
jgi:hypothetical protein